MARGYSRPRTASEAQTVGSHRDDNRSAGPPRATTLGQGRTDLNQRRPEPAVGTRDQRPHREHCSERDRFAIMALCDLHIAVLTTSGHIAERPQRVGLPSALPSAARQR